MRKYVLASASEREDVDLRDYEDIITVAVHVFLPEADVRVENSHYCVDPSPERGIAVNHSVGRESRDTRLCGWDGQGQK